VIFQNNIIIARIVPTWCVLESSLSFMLISIIYLSN